MAQLEEEVVFTPSGTLRLTFGGNQYLIGRPTIGAERKLAEAYADLVRREDEAKAAEAERNALDPTEREGLEPLVGFDSKREMVTWYRLLVDLLETSGKKLPDDDDELPSWFQGTQLSVDVRGKWFSVPYPAGANPKEQETSAAMAMMAQMAAVLPQLQQALPAIISAQNTLSS